jgi:hypothetical protein
LPLRITVSRASPTAESVVARDGQHFPPVRLRIEKRLGIEKTVAVAEFGLIF